MPLDKLSSKEIYSILRSNIVNKPTSNIYFEKLSENITIGWNKIYLSPRLATIDTIDTTDVLFNIKFLITYFFSTKKLCTFGITNAALCFFCNAVEETPMHIFLDCVHVKCLLERFQNDFILPSLNHRLPFLDCIMK